MKQTSEIIQNNLKNTLRMQAAYQVEAKQELERHKEVLKKFEEMHDEELVQEDKDEERLNDLKLHIAMEEEIIANYQLALINGGATEDEL